MDSCPACGGSLPEGAAIHGFDRLHRIPGTFEVRVCGECGTGRTFPLVPAAQMAGFYPQSYGAHAAPASSLARLLVKARFRWHYRRALRHPPLSLLGQVPPGRLLDVGAGSGDLGVAFADRGWEVVGLEPSAEGCKRGRLRGMTMVQGRLETTSPAELGAAYDAVVFQHSLEHVAEPGVDLERARGLLGPEGVVLVSLPNFGSWQSKAFGSAWFHLDLPRHRTHFTATGLERLLEKSGFERAMLTTSTTVDGLPMSLQYRLFGRRRFRSGLMLYLAAFLSLVLVPVSYVLNVLKGGGDELSASAVRQQAR